MDSGGHAPWRRPLAEAAPSAGRGDGRGSGWVSSGAVPGSRWGPKPGVPSRAVAEKVGVVGFTGPVGLSELDVAAAIGGDRVAFAAIYDRYSPRLYDFCVGMLRDRDAAADCVQDTFCTAAARLHQLREPDKLRSWLYAIARHEALRRIRTRRRERPTDEVPDHPSPSHSPDELAARTELAMLVDQAAGGLGERDRTVLELHYRHGLDGPELAAALGVSHTNANTLVGRLRVTMERSLGALLVARRAHAQPGSCADLDAVLEGWDGRFTALMRKRVARHLDRCPGCDALRRDLVSPRALLASAPVAVPAPFWLRDHALAHAGPHLPAGGAAGSATAAGGTAAAGGVTSPAAGTGASWWPSGALGRVSGGLRWIPGLHVTHLAGATAAAAVAGAITVVVTAAVSGEPLTMASSTPPSAVASAPPSAPRFAFDTPTATDRSQHPTVTTTTNVHTPRRPSSPGGTLPGPVATLPRGLPGMPSDQRHTAPPPLQSRATTPTEVTPSGAAPETTAPPPPTN